MLFLNSQNSCQAEMGKGFLKCFETENIAQVTGPMSTGRSGLTPKPVFNNHMSWLDKLCGTAQMS